jgi:hypothetical protein
MRSSVAHPRVLPIDDPDALAVIDEVRVEQVVVAGPELDRVGQERLFDQPADLPGALVGGRDRHASLGRQRPVCLADPQRDEQARDRRAIMDPTQRVRDAAERLGLADGLVGYRLTHDETGEQVPLGSDERGHLRPDPDPGGRHGRRVFHLPADAQQVGVVAGQADDPTVRRTLHVHPEVAVGDPAAQRRERQRPAGELRNLLHGEHQLVVQLSAQGRLVIHQWHRQTSMRRDDRSSRRTAAMVIRA